MAKVVYETLCRKTFAFLKNRYMVPVMGLYTPSKRVVVSLDSRGVSFSTYRKGTYYIVLDSEFLYEKVAPECSTIATKELHDKTTDTLMYQMGLFYHEYGHVQFTSFDNEKAFSTVPEKHRSVVQYLFNILEDPYIELQTKVKIKKSKKFLDFLVNHIFIEDANTYEDAGDFHSFARYLLLSMRLGITKIAKPNKFYDDHKKDIVDIVKEYYGETDGSKRAYIAIKLYKYLLDNGMDLDVAISDEESTVPTTEGGGAPAPGETRDASGIASSRMGGSGTTGSSKSKDKKTGAGDSITKDEDDGKAPLSDLSAGDFEAPTTEEFESYDEYGSGIATHEFCDLPDICNVTDSTLDKTLEYYNNTVNKFSDLVRSCTESIESFNVEHQVKMLTGYGSGHLDLDAYLRCNPIDKIYSRPSGVDNTPDLCFYVMVDGSGSMGGDKSRLCTQAMMILYECLTQLDIPFELSTFTNTGDCDYTNCLTYVLKGFDDDPILRKPYLGFTDSSIYSSFELPRGYCMFRGNYDEVNVGYCGERLLDRPNKDKVMIILSDGATCGSTEALKNKVKALEAEGVLVLGVGICSHSVDGIYDKRVIFSSSEELEQFPEFLSKFLVDLYTE